MENSDKSPISHLYKELKSRIEIRALIPMGYVPGMPVISIKSDQLIAVVPFLRYKVTGEVDRTLVYPIKYVLEYLIPEGQLVGFKDLAIEDGFEDFDFDKVIGFFRHESVKHMDRETFAAYKAETLSKFDQLVNYLLGENESYTVEDDKSLATNLQTIIEPFVLKHYAILDEDFYNKYLTK